MTQDILYEREKKEMARDALYAYIEQRLDCLVAFCVQSQSASKLLYNKDDVIVLIQKVLKKEFNPKYFQGTIKLQKRKWVWIMQPTAYEIRCDKCGRKNIIWSEFKKMIWCYDCKVDTPGDGGIFDGPIPIGIAGVFGISFDRIHIRTGKILKIKILDRKLIWKFERGGNRDGC